MPEPMANGDQAATNAGQDNQPVIKEETIADVIPQEAPKQRIEETVPLSKYMAEKKERQALESIVRELEIKNQSTPSKQDWKDIAEKYQADPELLETLERHFDKKYSRPTETVKETTVDNELMQKLDNLERYQREQAFDKKFAEMYDKALTIVPEMKDVANKDVIKSLVLLPENRSLTISQILEKTYGNAIKGNRTIEAARPQGGDKQKESVDFARMSDDDWETVKNNPDLKKQYDDYLVQSIRF